ncbi:hypothetical protein A2U01_0056996, partial [Trifolium medium]|nr:hypothetical protein [Trifolium medium]
ESASKERAERATKVNSDGLQVLKTGVVLKRSVSEKSQQNSTL